jgi:hypothetical protein
MPVDVKKLLVVLAGAGDVDPEIQQVRNAITEVNRTMHFANAKIYLDLIHWRTHAYPGLDPRGAQPVIDPSLGIEHCDIFLAVFWKRFGTPVHDADSGTEHEVREAVRSMQSKGLPRIMLYFSNALYGPTSPEETDQWSKVLRFKQQYRGSGFTIDFDHDTFAELVRGHLTAFSFDFIKRQAESAVATTESRPLVCKVTSNLGLLRAEGVTELLPAISLTFSGDLPTSVRGVRQTVNISVLLNTTITNRMTSVSYAEVFLLGPDHGQEVYRGQLTGSNVLKFSSVAIDTLPGVRNKTFVITNLRANAGSLATLGADVNVTAMISVEDVPVIDPVQIVGRTRAGLVAQIDAFQANLTNGKRPVLSQSEECSGQRIATLRFTEGFANAFKPRGTLVRGHIISDCAKSEDAIVTIGESGQFSKICTDLNGGVFVYGIANFGTRLLAVFSNVPSGVILLVSSQSMVSSAPACIQAFLTQSDNGPFSPVQHTDVIESNPVSELSLTNGTAVASWEIVRRERDVAGWLEIGVFVRFKPHSAHNKPELGTVLVTLGFAPVTTVNTASPTDPLPRFQDKSAPLELFTIGR